MTTELTEKQFKDTMTIPMVNVTETAEPIVDIWSYAEKLVDQGVVDRHIVDEGLVEYVYRNSKNTFDHILLPTHDKNIFTVLVVDLVNPKIIGHHTLDLNALYGLT